MALKKLKKGSAKRRNPEFSETRALLKWLKDSQDTIQDSVDYLNDYKDSDIGKHYISQLNKYSETILKKLKRNIQGLIGDLEYNIPNSGNAGTF